MKAVAIIVPLGAAILASALWIYIRKTDAVVAEADALMARTHHGFTNDTFAVATNVLAGYVAYLERNKRVLKARRRVEIMLLVPYSRLAFVCASVGDTNAALANLNSAYRYHVITRTEDGLKPLAKSDFAEFVMNGGRDWETRFPPSWRAKVPVLTGAVEQVRNSFTLPSKK